jgi:hypothetical protein
VPAPLLHVSPQADGIAETPRTYSPNVSAGLVREQSGGFEGSWAKPAWQIDVCRHGKITQVVFEYFRGTL